MAKRMLDIQTQEESLNRGASSHLKVSNSCLLRELPPSNEVSMPGGARRSIEVCFEAPPLQASLAVACVVVVSFKLDEV